MIIVMGIKGFGPKCLHITGCMAVEIYVFRPRTSLVLAPWEARALLRGGPVTVNLGLSRGIASPGPAGVYLEVNGSSFHLDYKDLEYAASDRYAWYYDDGSLRRVEVRGSSYMALEPVGGGAPTIWIDGIHMHRIKDVDPIRDASSKVRAARVGRGHKVLDICTGLGYTAISSVRRGASRVYSIEVSEDVLYIASLNPWSRMLGTDKITILRGDAVDLVEELPQGFFDRIIHDPPRLTPATGDLYGQEFYRRLYRLLKPGGILYHYTGEPGRGRRVSVPRGVSRRLASVGFEVLGFDRDSLGVVAVKPR